MTSWLYCKLCKEAVTCQANLEKTRLKSHHFIISKARESSIKKKRTFQSKLRISDSFGPGISLSWWGKTREEATWPPTSMIDGEFWGRRSHTCSNIRSSSNSVFWGCCCWLAAGKEEAVEAMASLDAANTSVELVKADSPEQKVKCVVVAPPKLKRGDENDSPTVWWDPSTHESPSRKPLITRGRRVSLLGRVLQHRPTSKHNNASRTETMDGDASFTNNDPER